MLTAVMGLLVIAIVAAGVGMARAQTITVSTNQCVNLATDLSLGMRSNDVKTLQAFLSSESLVLPKHVTGYFGPITEAAVKKYQASRQIAQTGTVNAATRSTITLFTCGSSNADFPNYVPMVRGLFGPQKVKAGAEGLYAVIINNEFSSHFSVVFDWGDGTKSQPQTINAKATHALTPTHVYTTPGTYDVNVFVTNPSGKVNGSTISVVVE